MNSDFVLIFIIIFALLLAVRWMLSSGCPSLVPRLIRLQLESTYSVQLETDRPGNEASGFPFPHTHTGLMAQAEGVDIV